MRQSHPQGVGELRDHHHRRRQRLSRTTVATAGRPLRPDSTIPAAWRWTQPATSTSRTHVDNRIRKVSASTGIITTVAGNGSPDYSGDGGAATAAGLYYPYGVAVDAAGNLYIADTVDNRIRKVSASTGIITTVAGNGSPGYSGDGGAATAAELYYPYGVAVDAAGNLYIADTGNNRIRKVSASTGIITTVAGNGTAGYSGDGGAATAAETRPALRRGGGCRRQPLHRGLRRQSHPRGLSEHGDHHHRRRQRHCRLQRRWRGGHGGRTLQPLRRGGGCRRQPLHRGRGRQSHPRGIGEHGDHHHRRRQRLRRLQRRRRGGHCGRTRLPLWRGGGCRRQPLHRGHIQQSHPRGLIRPGRHAADGQPGEHDHDGDFLGQSVGFRSECDVHSHMQWSVVSGQWSMAYGHGDVPG